MGEPPGSGTELEAAMVNQSVVEAVPDHSGSQVAPGLVSNGKSRAVRGEGWAKSQVAKGKSRISELISLLSPVIHLFICPTSFHKGFEAASRTHYGVL